MIFILHTFLCVLILFLIIDLPFLIGAVYPKFVLTDPLILICLHIVFIICFYVLKKFSLFSLPLSHLIFAVLFYFSLAWIRPYMQTQPDPGGWEMFAIGAGFFYFLPVSIITFIISLIIKLKK